MSTEHETDDEPTDESTPDPALAGDYDPRETEPRWQDYWVDNDVFAYEESETPDADTQFTIDTPPPTVSGSLHMGHLYQFTLQDFVARFRRMTDDTVYFPFGYDDNGIASERLTERELDIRHSDFERREFQEKTRDVCADYEDAFTEDVQSLAISVDWDNTYKTIEPRVQRISQLSFLDLYEQGKEYRQRAPTIWCPDCETAISQVEQEDTEQHTTFNDIEFPLVADGNGEADDGETLTISTTRPELLPACVSIFVHPDDDANAHLVGGTAEVPLFGQEVPIIEDERVDLETGSGVVMCCTFGDQTDIEWYQAHDLPLRIAIDESGTMTDRAGEYEGLSTTEAREAIIADLDDAGHLLESRDHHHSVQVHERCETEVEYLVTEQWYVDMLDSTEEYLEAGREMDWYPEKMFTRYKHWIEGLEWDWCISRQRDSGIPFPVWYCEDCGEPVFADREDLPVDPLSDDPPVDSCPECGGADFEPESDVFDTWATSSLTPLINAGWDWQPADESAETADSVDAGEFTFDNPELYPMNLRPQGHDIISFWLFHTVVKCYEHTGEIPFDTVMVNGMVLDENREAMSKSKGNVVSPEAVLEDFPVDATRYWAAGTSIGDDFPFKENDLEAGERLLQKLWNASKLVDQLAPGNNYEEPEDLAAIDEWLLAKLDDTIESLTEKLDTYEFSKARNELRTFFWSTFCDDYLEIAKQRDDKSAAYTLVTAHRTFLKLFAPFLPHVVEEIWQAKYAEVGERNSIHVSEWPEPRGYDADLAAGETAMATIGALRGYKTDHGMALNADIDRVEVYGDVSGFESAIQQAMHVDELSVVEDDPEISTEIAEISLDYATVGPKYGDQVGGIEQAIATDEYELDGDRLHAGDVTLEPDEFEVRKEHTYAGEGELVETDDVAIVVQS
ncbi:valyl-tRNA synthetase [Halorhabdus utahensis DSM 12940]|uniref:Valine--tRNA ligase n=1 Tax=Halorhabdus utahensis (strain DSM 12940 / JCM 11049 / AX-2) TaxID=519442 RepID=C7NPU6_HALUD|nr:valine--tRNA ligase [Halorhabdus utahensis]ACV10393.1 valyl-tRNA synthetase [Halorhabdus utahensis DSM 12940]